MNHIADLQPIERGDIMKIKLSGIKTTFEMENFEFSIGKKEMRHLSKKGRKHWDEEHDLRAENEALKKRLNDAHSQIGDMRKQLDAARLDAARR